PQSGTRRTVGTDFGSDRESLPSRSYAGGKSPLLLRNLSRPTTAFARVRQSTARGPLMSRLARLLRRIPFAGRWFGRSGRYTSGPCPHPAARSTGPALVGTGLTRSFGCGETKTVALQDVSVEFHPGQLNLLMGPSGSGKSTLLAVLSGLLRPDCGTVRAVG